MYIIDLTHTLSDTVPRFPGDPKPLFTPLATVAEDHYAETDLHFSSHIGTHMDAPCHIYEGRTSLDQMPIDQFIGSACVIDCRNLRGEMRLKELEPQLNACAEADFILFCTGWEKYWGTEQYLTGYPLLSDEVIEYIKSTQIKGIGFDTISFDDVYVEPIRRHQNLFRSLDLIVLENLCNLDQCIGQPFTLYALPLKYKQADGAPTRAIAVF